ncbi:MAG: 2-dehydro-3-deoxy-6-phosphogalactonate aldolase [Rhodospirillaceae bacterium]|nr:2-dehydro-3-deoxy-6-phosphogalactonate aldolase [Rhodospirillaceae bacterium]
MTTIENYLNKKCLIAILRGVQPAEVVDITTVLIEKGFNIVEIPLNSPQPIESIQLIAQRFGDHILVGAGTVIELPWVRIVAKAGAKLIVMPNANKQIVAATKKSGLIAIPGVATPTEAFSMIEAGADGLKLFPAEAAPPPVLRALKAIIPARIPVIPVGGITPEKLPGYIEAGATGFGLGSALYQPGFSPDDVAQKADNFNNALAGL